MANVNITLTINCSVPDLTTAKSLELELETRLYRSVEALLPSLRDSNSIRSGTVNITASRSRQSKIQINAAEGQRR